MSFFYLKKNLSFKKKNTLSEQISSSYHLLIIIILAFNIFLGALFLYIGNYTTAQGYIYKKLQLENKNLYSQNATLDAEIINAKTSKEIYQNQRLKQMTYPEKAAYLKDSTVAVKKLEHINP